MARDMRVGIQDYPDRCYYYDSKSIDGTQLAKDAIALGRFNKRDIIPTSRGQAKMGDNVLVPHEVVQTIETVDYCPDIRDGMYIVDDNGTLFRIVRIPSDDDENKSKQVGRRAVHTTKMEIKAIEE
jgi:hypothetical protein